MRVTKKKTFCSFALWTPKGMKVEKITYDQIFWE